MRKLLIIHTAVLLALAMVSLSAAATFETDFDDLHKFDRSLPAWKFGRGLTNFFTGPYEFLANTTNEAIAGSYEGAYDGGLQGSFAGGFNGFIAGAFSGTWKGLRRMTTGVMEMITFWKPEYGPTIEPEWGTRNRAFGSMDYFDPDPYWYWGPARD
jgi:putative exosortase-associated protein (TIGR04073 family)